MIKKLLKLHTHLISKRFFVCFFLILTVGSTVATYAKSPIYFVKRASFNSRLYDEISPFFIGNQMIFCSNRPTGSMRKFEKNDNFLFSIFYVEKKKSKWSSPKLFAPELTTQLNDGPITYNADLLLLFFSRNLNINGKLKDIANENNQMGLFSAQFSDGNWVDITPFPYNNHTYSLKSPALSADGKRIYFSSDMPGGYGGYDIYYCNWVNGEWQKPINMGRGVNTPLDETHPYSSSSGKLFFTSNGHSGLGGKDIYYTQFAVGEWQTPVHLDPPINSTHDDFGFVSFDDLETGYFSSNREGTDDIFHFVRSEINFENCIEQKENNFCYVFYDENIVVDDSISTLYEWEFEEGNKIIGEEVTYCFPGPGVYSVTLRVMDENVGDTINLPYSYQIELQNVKQPYINSLSTGLVGDTLLFDAVQTNLPEMQIDSYYWDFGQGFKQTGVFTSHQFDSEGDFFIKLGVIGELDNEGIIQKSCVVKRVSIKK